MSLYRLGHARCANKIKILSRSSAEKHNTLQQHVIPAVATSNVRSKCRPTDSDTHVARIKKIFSRSSAEKHNTLQMHVIPAVATPNAKAESKCRSTVSDTHVARINEKFIFAE